MAAAFSSSAVAFIGLGAMGTGMARRLVQSGFPLSVYNRTQGKAGALVSAGAVEVSSPAEAALNASVVVLSLADEHAVEEVLFGADGVAGAAAPDTVIVDTSTVSPAYSKAVTERLRELSLIRVEGCVVGNPLQASEGELRVFAAGREEDVAVVRPLLDTVGKQVLYLGEVGMGATLKIVFNTLLGAQLSSLAEAVGLATRSGLDADLVLGAIAESGFSSRVMAFRAQLLRQGRLEPAAFKTSLMVKDLELALDMADATGLAMPTLAAAAEAFRETVRAGFADKDAVAVCAPAAGIEIERVAP
ncbi:NAD(P)-dependent oxidoreductase [Amycolatopsis sp. NPDC059657]|uniref:NAD(P)-dependent oxidoreductase n=1 Tax=Amycolatopsis sp. NPDC059657 TaxID=3346899 RepID=UPI00366D51AA